MDANRHGLLATGHFEDDANDVLDLLAYGSEDLRIAYAKRVFDLVLFANECDDYGSP